MADLFRRAGRMTYGYDPQEVDQFFARAQKVYEGQSDEQITSATVRSVTFELVRHGYVTTSVDNALDRLDQAFTHKERAAYIAAYGQQAWFDQVTQRATTLYPRLTRPDGEKFRPSAKGERGYDIDEVDAFCARLVEYFNSNRPLSVNDIRKVAFTVRKGDAGYAEGPVDAFLDRAVEVLVAAE